MRAMKLGVSIQQIESKRSPAHVAQAVEHFLGKEKVPGSNPGVGSIILCRIQKSSFRPAITLPKKSHLYGETAVL